MSESTKHRMSGHQMLETVFNFDTKSIKVHQDEMSHDLSLSASTDSIVAVPTFLSVEQGVLQDARMFKRVSIFSSGPYSLSVAPKMGGELIEIMNEKSATMIIEDICCAQILLKGPSDAIMVLQG